MPKKTVFTSLLLVFLMINNIAFSQELTADKLADLSKTYPSSQSDQALVNAITNNDVNNLAFDRENFLKHDDLFNFKLDAKGITDQQRTGRCWMFAAYNIMRPAMLKEYGLKTFEFSQPYLFFYDKLEKANYFLEMMIDYRKTDINNRELQILLEDPVADGGWWNYAVNLIEKYGSVPIEIMPETEHSKNTRSINETLNHLLRKDAVEIRKMASEKAKESAIRKRKDEMLNEVYKVLVMHFGTPPEKFVWKYDGKEKEIIAKEYTPVKFYNDAVPVDLSEYVSLMDHPMHDYDKNYSIKCSNNMIGKPNMNFVNVRPEVLEATALETLKDSIPVWFAADIGKENDRKNGYLDVGVHNYKALMGVDLTMSKKERTLYHSGAPSHAMVFIGVDMNDDVPEKWLVENSWGIDTGNKGYWTMYRPWFYEYVYTVIVPKKYVPESVLKIFDTKPKELPIWDPMRSAF